MSHVLKIGSNCRSFSGASSIRSLQMIADPSLIADSSSLVVSAITNAWSVSGETLGSADFASSLFAVSLFPYLAFLWFLSRPETKTPKGVNQGFQFLLVFVFLTIPAGIIAKTQYHDILANIDYLHGGAESMLTITNLLIIFGFRATRPQPVEDVLKTNDALSANLKSQGAVAIGVGAAYAAAILFIACHPDPANSLSIPTWAIHSSSLLEWLYAMKLAWEHAEFSKNPKWRNLTWAMIPSHTSGLCACTYHFFYNSPLLSWIVSLQAGLTVTGNAALALAAYQIYSYGKQNEKQSIPAELAVGSVTGVVSTEKETETPILAGFGPLEETNFEFNKDLIFKSFVVAFVVKYGELFFDTPFNAQPQDALALIFIPTLFNIGKWASRSRDIDNPQNEPSAI